MNKDKQIIAKLKEIIVCYKNIMAGWLECISDLDRLESELSSLKAMEGEEVISEWIRFEDKLPLEGQEIMLTWPSGNYHPEYRKVTNEMLKGNCSLLRWIPIPKY